jgi:hypothetical protein
LQLCLWAGGFDIEVRHARFNECGQNGSQHNSDSIWNSHGTFGSEYSNYSPWNQYTSSGPVIVDNSGHFYGRFTANKYVSDRTHIEALNQLADIVATGANLDTARKLFCGD